MFLRKLFPLFPSIMLFFAGEGGGAGGDGGAGAGGDAGGAGASGGGGAAVAEGEEAGGAGAGGEGGDGAGAGEVDEAGKLPGDTSDDDHPERDDIDQDGRTLDKRMRSAIDKLGKSADPELKGLAKVLRDTHFANQAVLKEFPGSQSITQALREIRTMKATLEAVGGGEGIEELQNEVTDYRNEIAQFANGDKALMVQLADAKPESAMMAARNMLDVLAGKDVKLLDQAVIPTLVARLDAAKLPDTFQQIMQLCVDGKGQEAFDLAKKCLGWTENLKKIAGDLSKNHENVDPRKRELDERERTLKQKEAESYERGIGNEVTRYNNAALGKVLTADFWKQVGLAGKDHGEGRRDFTQGLQNRIWAAMKADKIFQKNAHAIKAKGDATRTARFIADKFEEIAPDIFRQFRNIRFPSIGQKKTPGGGGGSGNGAGAGAGKGAAQGGGSGTGGGNVIMGQKPAPNEIDWTKTTDKMFNIGGKTGEAYSTKTGKLHRWEWAKI